jgi:hypothetical protein
MDEQNTQDTTATELPETENNIEPDADAPDMPLDSDGMDIGAAPAMDMAPAADAAIQGKMQTLGILHDLSQNVIYLMGLSFILGSLFTVFVLLVLDFMRRNNTNGK